MARRYTKINNPAMTLFFSGLGKKVKELRKKKGMSQAKVAEKADIGIRHYQDLEAGYVVSLRLVWSVANALEVPVSKITRGLGPGID